MLSVGESGKTDTLLLSQLSKENAALSAAAGTRTGAQQRPQAPSYPQEPRSSLRYPDILNLADGHLVLVKQFTNTTYILGRHTLQLFDSNLLEYHKNHKNKALS